MTGRTLLRRKPADPDRPAGTLLIDLAVAVAVALVAAGVGWGAAQTGTAGIAAVGALLVLVTAIIVAPQPTLLVQGSAVLSLTLLLHKSFGPLAENVHSGALGFTISTLNLALAVLYMMWWAEGTLMADVGAALRKPVFWAPLAGLAAAGVSMLAAADVGLAAAELFRLSWIYLLFLYFGVRIRSRTEMRIVIGALAAIAVIEAVLVALQWKTGGVLGLAFLGVPTELGERVFDAGAVGRPFGTIVHPVFMGATMATLGLLALSLAVHLRSARHRMVALGFVALCLAPIAMANARAAAVAFAIAAAALIGRALVLRKISWTTLIRVAAVITLLALPFLPALASQFGDSFLSNRVDYELESRIELNHVAMEMFDDSPILGVGLNNFEQALDGYDRYGLIFGGNPVHNLFLLQASETGIVGLLGLLLVGTTLAAAFFRAARSTDPLAAAVGSGAAAMLVFYLFEEQLGFSLRQEVPLALFWILAGLAVASLNMPGPTSADKAPRHVAPRRISQRTARMGPLAIFVIAVTTMATLGLPSTESAAGEPVIVASEAGAAPVVCDPTYLDLTTPAEEVNLDAAPAGTGNDTESAPPAAAPVASGAEHQTEEGAEGASPGAVDEPDPNTVDATASGDDADLATTEQQSPAEDPAATIDAEIELDCTQFVYPLVFPVTGPDAGSVTSSPTGASLPAPPDTAIVTGASGVVAWVGGDDECCGVAVHHDDGWTSWYIGSDILSFVRAPGVEVGTPLAAGALLGWTGGERDAMLISFELRDARDRLVDPIPSLMAADRLAAAAALPGLPPVEPPPERLERPTDHLRIVFSAKDRGTGRWGIYTADGDGTNIVRLTPDDGTRYNWPSWALGGQKIIFTARHGNPGSAEGIYWMNPDGTGVEALTSNQWRNAQPHVSADGRRVVFSSAWDEYPYLGVYLLDLETLEVENLSGAAAPRGAVDSDPKWTPDGRLVYARSADDKLQSVPTQIWTMGADGTSDRRSLAADGFNNVDPEVSPDGTRVAYSSYRAERSPARGLTDLQIIEAIQSGSDERALFEIAGWNLVVKNLSTGTESILTRALDCDQRPITEPCEPAEGSAFVTSWAPDANSIGFVSALSESRACICVIDSSGGNSWATVDSFELDIDWFDWIDPGNPAAGGVPMPGAGRRSAEILTVSDGRLLRSTPDLWGYEELPLPDGLEPLTARWSPDKSQIVFTALTPYDRAAFDPGPAPPAGSTRHVHFVLDDLLPIFDPPTDRENAAEEQVFLLDLASGVVKQLTNPWIEDYMDALRDGDARGNTDPVFSPDATSIVFTNVSTLTGESALLRLDLDTGRVYNLTNATAGAVPVADFEATFFPDGSRLAFTTPIGLQNQIMVMDATDGTNVRQLTDDDFFNISPALSPDGRTLVYVSYRGTELFRLSDEMPADDAGVPVDGWYLVAIDLQTGDKRLLTRAGDPPAFAPVWIDDGTAVMFVSMGPSGQPDLYRVDAMGASPPRPIQVTLRTGEVSVDWR